MVTDVRMSSLTYIKTHSYDIPLVIVAPGSDTLPFRKGVFDVILGIEVPDLTENDINFFPRVAELLRVGGRLVVTVTNRLSYKYLPRRLIRKEHDESSLVQDRVYRYSAGEIIARAESAEFVRKLRHGYNWIPFPKTSNSRFIGLAARIERMMKLNGLPSISPWVACCFEKI